MSMNGTYDDGDLLDQFGGRSYAEDESPSPPQPRRHHAVIVPFSDIAAEPIRWLWKDHLARGKLTALVSTPGLGKSMMTCDLAARCSNGAAMPDNSPGVQGGCDVILCNPEDGEGDTIRPRLDAADANVARVHHLRGVMSGADDAIERVFTLADIPILADALAERQETGRDVGLVVLDPIGSFLTGGDSHRDSEVRMMMAPLVKLAADFDVAVLLVMHRRKSLSRVADDMVMGSRAFTGVVRQVWHVVKHPDDARKRLLLPGKCNIAAAPSGMSFGFWGEGQQACLAWDREPVNMSADDAMSREVDGAGRGENEDQTTARDEARHFLLTVLADGPRPSKEVEREARQAGISVTGALRRARQELCDRPTKEGFDKGTAWVWRLNLLSQVEANEIAAAEGAHEGAQRSPTATGCTSSGEGAHLRKNKGEYAVREGSSDPATVEDEQRQSVGEGGS